MELEVKIVLVPMEQTGEDADMFRVSCDGLWYCGWGKTLEEAIKNFDDENNLR